MTTPSHKTSLAFALGLLLALLLPAANLARLDGLPLASLTEVIVLLLIAPLLLWREIREAAWALVQRVRFGPALAWSLLGLVFAAKAAMLVAGPMQGWPGCYRAAVLPVASYRGDVSAPDCERSFDNPFFRGRVTRFDRTLDFEGDTWNLGFMNSGRFDFYDWQPGTILRTRLPFEAVWSASLATPAAYTLRVAYVGEGALTIDGNNASLAPAYAEAASLQLPLAAGIHKLELRYRFDDGSRSGQDSAGWGPRAMLHVTIATQGGTPALAAPVAAAIWIAIAGFADLALALLALLCLLAIARAVGRELLAAIAMLAAATGLCLLPAGRVEYVERVFGEMPLLQVSFAVLAMLLLAAHIRARRLAPATLYLALAALALATMRQAYPSWDRVALRGAGNDNLSAESQARSILQTSSLQGEEAVYYSQPFYRYIKFAEHALFGEGDVLYGSMVLLAALGGAFFALERLRSARVRGALGLLWLLSGAALLGLTGFYMARFVRDGMAEYPTWIALLWVFPLLFAPTRPRDVLWGALLLGLASITRTDQLPGNGLMLLAALWMRADRRWVTWLAPLAVFGGVGLLPLLHNLVYGGAFVLTTTSAGVVGNLILGPSQWLGMLRGEATAWSALLSQIGLLSFAVPLESWQAPVGMFAHIILVAWLAVAGLQVGRRNWRETVVLLLPLPYILTHIVFVVQTYYPRHAIMGVLVMALAVLFLLASRDSAHPLQPAPRPSRP